MDSEGDYIAKCNHSKCKARMTFGSEEAQMRWGEQHKIIFGEGHRVFYGKKVTIK